MSPNSSKNAWQMALMDLVTDPHELWEMLELDPYLLNDALKAHESFSLRVTRKWVNRMEKGNIHDPLLQQVLTSGAELVETKGYETDPLQEQKANPIPGLLHKYQSRVLITLTNSCAVHCRYCFRRHFPYSENNPGTLGLKKIFAYIGEHPKINEIILSGGDPLTVSDKVLTNFTQHLSNLPQITRIRIHTRIPLVLPERITNDFMNWVKSLSVKLIIVIHANHSKEINHEVKESLQKLKQSGVTLLNQSVLLKGINDSEKTLIELSESLFDTGVMPYYLHVLDKVKGAAHFDIDRAIAVNLIKEVAKHLPGYLVPKLACEEAGKEAKTVL